MEALAEKGLENPKIHVSMDVETWLGEQLLKVRVYDCGYVLMASQDYVIIGGIEDEFDVLDQTVEKAAAALARKEEEKKEEEKKEEESTTDTK